MQLGVFLLLLTSALLAATGFQSVSVNPAFPVNEISKACQDEPAGFNTLSVGQKLYVHNGVQLGLTSIKPMTSSSGQQYFDAEVDLYYNGVLQPRAAQTAGNPNPHFVGTAKESHYQLEYYFRSTPRFVYLILPTSVTSTKATFEFFYNSQSTFFGTTFRPSQPYSISNGYSLRLDRITPDFYTPFPNAPHWKLDKLDFSVINGAGTAVRQVAMMENASTSFEVPGYKYHVVLNRTQTDLRGQFIDGKYFYRRYNPCPPKDDYVITIKDAPVEPKKPEEPPQAG